MRHYEGPSAGHARGGTQGEADWHHVSPSVSVWVKAWGSPSLQAVLAHPQNKKEKDSGRPGVAKVL